jgi:hypothetical protein
MNLEMKSFACRLFTKMKEGQHLICGGEWTEEKDEPSKVKNFACNRSVAAML